MSSEEEKEQIKQQAKSILNSFAKALERVKVPASIIERPEDRRQEGQGTEPDKEFREIMFKDAPKSKDDCIEAERGAWIS